MSVQFEIKMRLLLSLVVGTQKSEARFYRGVVCEFKDKRLLKTVYQSSFSQTKFAKTF